MNEFRIAPMSTGIRIMTAALFATPVVMLAAVIAGYGELLLPVALVCAIYGWVWLRFRPSAFIIRPDCVEIVWPLKRCEIPRSGIHSCRVLDAEELRREAGRAVRVGAGGLWGGFGWLWTRRRGIVQMYVSRTDAFVWIERGKDRPWLITPEHPEAFVRELAG